MRVGTYELKEVIGDGGTGAVYLGQQFSTDKQVAIKVLHSRRQDVVDQLVRGAQAVGRVHHANLVDMTDVGATRDGTVYLAMELLEGETLQERLHRVGPLPLFDAINIVRQMAHGLGAAHAAGVVHGGLEPAKIFLCRRDGRRRIVRRSKTLATQLVVEPEGRFDLVKLLDLGLKRFLDLASYQSGLLGSVRYWSPEQAQRRSIELRSDIYSLGAVFYEMVTGTAPFDGASLVEVLRQHNLGVVTAPSQRTPSAGIDSCIDGLILRCLQKVPNLRFANTDELCEALDACITDCAFLRDAHRLPGIKESGIELPEMVTKKHPNPTQTTTQASVAPMRQAAPSTVKPLPPRIPPTYSAVPTAQVVAKPVAIPVPDKPVLTRPEPRRRPSANVEIPVEKQRVEEPRFEKPPVPPAAVSRTVQEPTAAMVTALPVPLATVGELDLPKTATPPPIALPSDLLTEIPDEASVVEPEPPTSDVSESVASVESKEVQAEATASEVTSPRMLVDPDDDLTPVTLNHWRRPRGMALAAVALLCALGFATWAVRSRSTRHLTGPVVARVPPPLPTPAVQASATTAATPESETRRVHAAEAEPAPVPETPPLHVAASETPLARPLVPPPAGSAAPESVPAAESPPAPAAAPRPLAKASTPLEAIQASEATAMPARAAEAVPVERKPALEKLRPLPARAAASTAQKPTVENRTPTAVTPKQATAAPAALPPRLAAAWANVPRNPPALAVTDTDAKPAPRSMEKSTEKSKAAASKATAQPAPTNVDQLVREAQQAWLGGQHSVAISRAQAALLASPRPAQAVQAYEIIATCSCILQKRDRALEAASHLSSSRREAVQAVCAKNGVPFE